MTGTPNNYAIAQDRSYSAEGFLTAKARLAVAGDLEYKRGEFPLLGGDPNEDITLHRSKETLQKALDTFAGRPITYQHPAEFLDTGNAKEQIIGAVTSTPTIDEHGNVDAQITIYDSDAISQIESGRVELSPGFLFLPPKIIDGRGTIEDMQLNHIAYCGRTGGRAGDKVRIMDSLPQESIGITIKEPINMATEETKIADVLQRAVDNAQRNKTDIVEAVKGVVQPLIDDVATLKAKDAKAEADVKLQKAQDEADKARQQAVDAAVKGERDRYKLIEQAKAFVAEDQHASLVDMETKDILKAAIGDAANDVDDVAVMDGIFRGMKIQAAKNASNPNAQAQDQSTLVKRDLSPAEDARSKRYAEMFAQGRSFDGGAK